MTQNKKAWRHISYIQRTANILFTIQAIIKWNLFFLWFGLCYPKYSFLICQLSRPEFHQELVGYFQEADGQLASQQ